ncbi:LppP/LprE family lipoprotein [Gulosibacter sp. 10]|uniref:LppP/LprE family lipoprotein n=1 Tax=Gulosibacter sp. 10 TaxID=1255570 RepID=UPI00097EBAB9|nr:LppP/LprE family lipoprotein [Gulosibacter sp. 10]SJM58014.1 hypothetical protein FM112_05595 [Gulosibacter sp. 10]
MTAMKGRAMRGGKGLLALVVAGVLALTGCADGPDEEALERPEAEETVAERSPESDEGEPEESPAQEPPSTEPDARDCGLEASGALDDALAQMPPPFEDEHMADVAWSAEYADTEGYDPCEPFTWMVVSVEGGTVSSPSQVVFFHHGEYVGTAAEPAIGFWPEVERVDELTIRVAFRYPEDDEANAEASGRATAEYTWDEPAGTFTMSGEFPPYAQDAEVGNR